MDSGYLKLGIINKALVFIGAKKLTSLTDGSSNQLIMTDIYDQVLLELFEEHPFSFGVKTAILVPLNPPAWVTSTNYAVGTFIQQGGAIYVCTIANTSGVFATDLSNGKWTLQSGATPLLTTLPDFGDGVSLAYALPTNYLATYLVNIASAQMRLELIQAPVVASDTLLMLSDTVGIAIKYFIKNITQTMYTAKFYNCLALKLAYTACFKISEAAQYEAKLQADYDKALISAIAADSKNSTPDQPIQNEWFVARLAGSGVAVGLPNDRIGFFPNPFNPEF